MPIRNIFVIALTAIISMTCYSTASRNRFANLFAEAITTIESEALQVVPRDELFEGAMDGMTSKLDGHSRFINQDDYRIFREDMDQEFGGVGMYVDSSPETGILTVLAPIPGTPAFEAGIRSGDTILEIGGKPVKGLSQTEAVKLIRGPRGQSVDVLIERDGEPKKFSLTREFIHEPSVHGDYRNDDASWVYRLKDRPRIGYIRLLQFGSKSSHEMESAIRKIDGDIDALILDLRNNTGGLLDGAIEICDLFLEKGALIVSTHGRNNTLLQENRASRDPVFSRDKPLVVLVNRESASASEVVSACLQDHHRATIIGESTWGKGTVQLVIPIEKGRSALKLTTASYWRPSGLYIDRYSDEASKNGTWGVHPDEGFTVEMSDEESFHNRRLRNLLDLRGLIPTEELRERDRENLLETEDGPLQRAIQFLEAEVGQQIAA